jgi:hypothetical protein
MAEPPFGHESSAVALRPILGVGAVLAAGVVLTASAIVLVLHQLIEPTRTREHARPGMIPPAPRLEAHPARDLATLRAQEQARLESWGWTDDTRRFAHIPIERAMAIYVREHPSADSASDAAAAPAPQSGP